MIGDNVVSEEDVLKVLKATGGPMTASQIAEFVGVNKNEVAKY